MSNVNGFNIDENVSFIFDTGGAVPESDNLGKAVNCMVMCHMAGEPIIGNLEILEVE